MRLTFSRHTGDIPTMNPKPVPLHTHDGRIVHPVVTFNGGFSHWCIDDHCYVLYNGKDGAARAVQHVFPEALEVLKSLPTAHEVEDKWYPPILTTTEGPPQVINVDTNIDHIINHPGSGNTTHNYVNADNALMFFRIAVSIARDALKSSDPTKYERALKDIASKVLEGEAVCDNCDQPFDKPGFSIDTGKEKVELCGWECLQVAGQRKTLRPPRDYSIMKGAE